MFEEGAVLHRFFFAVIEMHRHVWSTGRFTRDLFLHSASAPGRRDALARSGQCTASPCVPTSLIVELMTRHSTAETSDALVRHEDRVRG